MRKPLPPREDRERLDGYVRRIFQKGAFSRDELIREIRLLLQNERGPDATGGPDRG